MNKEKLKGYWEKTKETLGKVSRKIWILIAAIVLVLVLAVVIYINTRPYSTLNTGATDDEFATVISWLKEQGVTDYKTEGSNTILVPEGQAITLKAQLLQEQYSTSNSPWTGYFERVQGEFEVEYCSWSSWAFSVRAWPSGTRMVFDPSVL